MLFARESSPDASSSIAQIVSRSPIFFLYDCFVLEQRRRSKKTSQQRRPCRRSKTELETTIWLVRLLLESRRRLRRLRRTPKPSPSERLQKAGGRRREKKEASESFFLRPSFLGFQMLTFFSCASMMSDAVLTIL